MTEPHPIASLPNCGQYPLAEQLDAMCIGEAVWCTEFDPRRACREDRFSVRDHLCRGALITGEERQHRAECVEAKVLARWDAEAIALRYLEAIAHRQPANRPPLNRADRDPHVE